MTARNVYGDLAQFKAFVTARGQTVTTSDADDALIDDILEAASRYADSKCGRYFYPRIETRHYSLPASGMYQSYKLSELDFGADLQEVITFLNGDTIAIASTEYNLLPRDETPKYGLRLKANSSLTWNFDSSGNWEYVIPLTAIWGYHNRYGDAWKNGGTLNEDLDTSELGFDVVSASLYSAGQIIKIDNEINIIDTIATNTLNVIQRADNGSTAATHANGTIVYIWMPMDDLQLAVLETALRIYRRKSGQSQGGDSTVLPSGAVLPPKEIPTSMSEFIKTYQRRML